MGQLPIRIGIVGHQTQRGGGEHLPPGQVRETGMPSLTIPLHFGDGRSWSHARRPPIQGRRASPPGRRENHGPDFCRRYRPLPPRHTREYGKGPKGPRYFLQGIRGKNQLEQIKCDMGQQKR